MLRRTETSCYEVSTRYWSSSTCAALAVAVVILAPFVWLVIASVCPPADLIARPYSWCPAHLDFCRYSDIFTGRGTTSLAPSASRCSTPIVASAPWSSRCRSACLGAYAFALLRFRFRRLTLIAFLATYMLPPIALLIPLYLIMARCACWTPSSA